MNDVFSFAITLNLFNLEGGLFDALATLSINTATNIS